MGSAEGHSSRLRTVGPGNTRRILINLRPSFARRLMPQFKHMQLSDAEETIRLIHLQPGRKGDVVCVSTVYAQLSSLPEYFAISYTWGSQQDCRTITIDKKPFKVRFNCFYALWQARLHYPGHYIWIDSICINQANLAEKSVQVRMMEDIYSKAVAVLVCLGPHADGSDKVFQLTPKELDVLYSHKAAHEAGDQEEDPELRDATKSRRLDWTFSFRREDWAHLYKGNNAIRARTYWSRAWILQEIALAKEVQMLCGENKIPWAQITMIEGMVGELSFASLQQDCSDSVRQHIGDLKYEAELPDKAYITLIDALIDAGPRSRTVEEVILLFGTTGCADGRDHIYAFVSLINWDTYGVHPLVPDYTQPALDLAIQVMDIASYELKLISDLLRALNINYRCARLQELIRARRVISKSRSGNTVNSYQAASASRRWVPAGPSQPFRISSNAAGGGGDLSISGCTCGGLRQDRVQRAKIVRGPITPSNVMSQLHRAGITAAQKFYDGRTLVALASAGTSAGDFLVLLDRRYQGDLFLVLRPSGNDLYDIVCQAFGLVEIDDGFGKCCADVYFNLTVEDLVLVLGQDLKVPDDYEFDVEARINRLITPVTSQPCQAARVVWQH